MTESWKLIPGTDLTEVSNLGRIRRRESLGRYKMLKLHKTPYGKTIVNMALGGIHCARTVDRLVGAAFCKDYGKHLRAVYKNGNRDDVRASNLRWVPIAQVTVPPRGNAKKTSKLTPEQVLQIREEPGTIQALADKYGVNNTTISSIKRRETWRHL